jgi:aflatoxin B1 aldehyde reductase
LEFSQTPLGKVYQEDYFKDKLFEASARLQQIAKDANLTGHAVALRWILHHSALGAAYGDKVIIGSSSIAQCKENLDILAEGPLDDGLVKSLDEIWEMARDFAPAYHR